MWLKHFYELLKEAANDFVDDHATKLSASLAYYFILSIGPILLILITLLSFIYKKSFATKQVFEQVAAFMGKKEAAMLKSMLEHIARQNIGTLFGIIGAVVLIFGATSIFTEIQSSINYIWSIRAKPKKGWLKYIEDRLLSFFLIIVIGCMMIISLFINLVIDLLSNKLQRALGHADIILLRGANIGLMVIVIVAMFMIIYKVLPDAKVHWKDALVGASFTAVLFLSGKVLMSYYFGVSRSFNAYGAAASIILLLTWVYYSAIILYFGAEFTKVYAMKWGKGITVVDTAVYIIKREAAELPALRHPVEEP